MPVRQCQNNSTDLKPRPKRNNGLFPAFPLVPLSPNFSVLSEEQIKTIQNRSSWVSLGSTEGEYSRLAYLRR